MTDRDDLLRRAEACERLADAVARPMPSEVNTETRHYDALWMWEPRDRWRLLAHAAHLRRLARAASGE